MRDLERIERIILKINNIWLANPDWRLGQLIVNIMSKQSESGLLMRPTESEIFNIEDDKFEKRIDKFLKGS